MPFQLHCRRCLLALLGILAATGSARAGPIAPDEPCAESRATPKARDLSCYVAPRELARWRAGGDTLIVDARSTAEFRRARIPGSINLPLHSLLGRGYLKSRKLLLVDRGYLGEPLEAACRELRAAGFGSVGIVEGGLSAWAQTVGELEGDRTLRRSLDRIPEGELARSLGYDHWIVVDVSETHSGGFPGRARAMHVPLRADPAEFRRDLASAIGPLEPGPGARFVAVILDDGSRQREVSRALSSLGVVHAFFVEGGLRAYRSAAAPASGAGVRCEVP